MATPSLRETIRPGTLQPAHDLIISAIDQHDFSRIIKKAAKELVNIGKPVDEAFLLEGLLALKQYYAIAVLDPLNMHAVSPEVDEFWHLHVLFTQDYADF